jgi:4-amino-4-deoxy-L-arabinose transferase-like glycosyltransferase
MLKKSWRYFLLASAAALALRLLFYFKFPHVVGDSLIYGDIAKNWLDHGVFGLSHPEGPSPTWIRLPGYPAFLALCFALFGREHYNAVLLAQIVIDVVSCFFIADLARRTVSERAARFAFLLAALCPFTANYTVAPLAETLSIFFTAVALDCAVAGLSASEENRNSWPVWVGCGVAVAAGILLRPDGGILLIAIGLFLLWRIWKRPEERARLFWAGALVLVIAIAPLVPWTLRNWRDFHRFQPLAPRYASDPDEFVPSGFDKWMRTWVVDYVSTEEVYWQVPGDDIDLRLLPSRAFDSEQQRQQTQAIFDDYQKVHFVGPELNARFDALANERIRGHRLRYYVWLPVLRIGDMWLRPRTEMLPLATRWWEFRDDPHDSIIAIAWGALNLLLVLAAVMGAVRGPRPQYLALMLLLVALRSALLGTLENPEPRYTLECYPVVLVLGAAWISGLGRRMTARR